MKAKKNINSWQALSAILLIVLVASVFTGGFRITAKVLPANEVANSTIDFINKYVLKGQATATAQEIFEQNGVYALRLNISGQSFLSYVTKDGSLLFPSVINMTQIPSTSTTQTQEIPKSDTPSVKLFVMAFCPYGIQAEEAMKPVVDLLGSKVIIEPHFIVSVSGNITNSLHGDYEAKEDIRQACIWKNYGQTVFWKYVDYINSNCNKNNIDTCWKNASNNASINTTKIEICASDEGIDLMKAEEALANQNAVSSSPTILINGVQYSGERDSNSLKEGICSAFNSPPTECNQTLSSTSSTTASGDCG